MKTHKTDSGLTLIELIVTIAASSIVVLTIALVLLLAFRSWRINCAFVDLRRNAALATRLISRDIRESDISDVSAGSQLTLQPLGAAQVNYTKTGDSLNSSAFGSIIPHGVQVFTAQTNAQGDGVYFTLVLTNMYHIAITNEIFVNTRN